MRTVLFWNPVITIVITFMLGGTDDFWYRLLYSFIVASVVSNFCFFVVALATLTLRRTRPDWGPTTGWGWSISLVAMPFGLYLAFKVAFLVGPYVGLSRVHVANADDYRFGFFIGTLVAALFFLLRTRADAQARAARLQNERLRAQVSALTAQMNPHLLFNALNSVAELVRSNPQLAEDTILQLSSLYRGVLNSSRQLKHSLQTELDLCESYLAIEKVRFADRLRVEIDVACDRSVIVPALCLQPLVENAVKHGVSPRARGGSVWLRARSEGDSVLFVVEDDGVGLGGGASGGGAASGGSGASAGAGGGSGANAGAGAGRGAGTGLQNCRERLALHYGEQGSIDVRDREGGGVIVEMRIPGV